VSRTKCNYSLKVKIFVPPEIVGLATLLYDVMVSENDVLEAR